MGLCQNSVWSQSLLGVKYRVLRLSMTEAEYRKRRHNLRMMHTVLLGSSYVAFFKGFFPVDLFRYICRATGISS